MVESSDESEVILSLIDVHGVILSDISFWRQVKGVAFAFCIKSSPLTALIKAGVGGDGDRIGGLRVSCPFGIRDQSL